MSASDYRGRRPDQPTDTLPAGRSRMRPPPWPFPDIVPLEAALWDDLWHRRVAHLWRTMDIPPAVVARYVRVLVTTPGAASLAAMEAALALTPASLRRLRVQFAAERPAEPAEPRFEVIDRVRRQREAS